MKKIQTAAVFLTGCLALAPLAACGTETVNKIAYELPYYDGNYKEELDDLDKPKYNNELWRRGEIAVEGADPLVLDDTANTGYYYAYVTGFNYYYSENLEDWFHGGGFMQLPEDLNGSEAHWAPEVIYDETEEQYYAFFTLTPPADSAMEGAPGPTYLSMTATSKTPTGPFIPVDMSTIRTLDQTKYPQKYAKYALLDSGEYQKAFQKEGLPYSGNYTIFTVDGGIIDNGYVRAIDFHPYIDPDTKEKYLFWSQTPGSIAGVKMTNWVTPDWSTYKTLTACRYYTVADYKKAQNGEQVQTVSYEEMAAYCNEGPFMYKHNGKYYLTFSIGAYDESSYGVMQAVADSPLGDFIKLSDSENGMLLNNDIGENRAIAGPGHHSFITLNENGENKLLIAYHAHNNPNKYTGRHVRFDEVKWITVKDVNGNDLDVMHVNGPSYTVQPTFGIGKEYGDITSAVLKCELVRGSLAEKGTAYALTDGLISYYNRVSQPFDGTYVKEVGATVTSTFEITLDGAHDVRGIMFYNSKIKENMFQKIKDIAFITEENGAEKIYLIKELLVNKNTAYFYSELNDEFYPIYGGSVYADFDAISVKKIRFTVEVPEGQKVAAVSEVAIVGKK